MRKDVEEYVSKCSVCNENKTPANDKVFRWPAEEGAWHRVHMDHAFIPGVGLVLILVDSMSGWPEVFKVPDRTAASVKKVLETTFARFGIPTTLVSDNAAEFHDQNWINWLLKLGCKPVKTPPYHPQSNGLAERMVKTIKTGMKAWNKTDNFNNFLYRMLLNYRCVPHGDRSASPGELMLGRRIRNPFTLGYNINSEVLYDNNKLDRPEKVTFLGQKGLNTAFVLKSNAETILAHADQLKPLKTPETPVEIRSEISTEVENPEALNQKLTPREDDPKCSGSAEVGVRRSSRIAEKYTNFTYSK